MFNKWTPFEVTNKMKRQFTEWGKIFANDGTDEGLVSKIYKQLMQLNILKKKSNQKCSEDVNRHVSNEDIQRAQSSLGTLSIRSSPLNLFLISTV